MISSGARVLQARWEVIKKQANYDFMESSLVYFYLTGQRWHLLYEGYVGCAHCLALGSPLSHPFLDYGLFKGRTEFYLCISNTLELYLEHEPLSKHLLNKYWKIMNEFSISLKTPKTHSRYMLHFQNEP